GASTSPVRATWKERPPAVGERTVLGHAPLGAGMMSAACLRCAFSAFAETVSFTYGVLPDAVRWQIFVGVASVCALAVVRAAVSAAPANARTASNKPSRFIAYPP